MDAALETLYRECMLAYTLEVMNNLDGEFVPARDLRAVFKMGYEAGQTGQTAKFEKKKRRKPNFGGCMAGE